MDDTKVNVNSDSEDEIFFGEVRSPERRKAKLLSNRRTEVFNAPLFVQHQPSSMAPRDDVSKTYSKVPPIKNATESERAQIIKQRPPPLPPFTQLFCSKDGQSLNSPFHLLTNTKQQTINHCNYRSMQSILPLPSPHMHSMPVTSQHLLSVPSQEHRRICLSPGLSPSFFYDPFDKLLQYNGHRSREENVTPDTFTAANTSFSSTEDVMSPAGLLFCSPILPITQLKVSKKMKIKEKNQKVDKRKTIISETSSSGESNGRCTPNEFTSKSQVNLDGNLKTPDLFFTSSWITRRNKYRKNHLETEMETSSNADSSIGKGRLHRSCSVPEIQIIHPEESNNSFMSIRTPSITSNSWFSSELNNLNHEFNKTTTENGITSPNWLLTMTSALSHSLFLSDTQTSNYAQSPLLSDLGKTFDTVSTLTPIISKHISYNKKPLSTTLRGIINNS